LTQKKRNLKSSKNPHRSLRTVGIFLLHFCIIPVKRTNTPTSNTLHSTLREH
jgi:hypothetical protein